MLIIVWSLIKYQWKDFSNLTSLEVDGQCVTSPLDKTKALNQFFTFFTDENTSFPNLEPSFPAIENLSFSTKGIESILNNLSTDKSPGLDCIPNIKTL